MESDRDHKVFIVSDGTCRTCEQVVKSALVQFDDPRVKIVLCPGIRTNEHVIRVVDDAAREKAIIFFTLVKESARKALKDAANERLVESIDVLGPALTGLNSLIRRPPRATPGLFYRSEREHFDRMDAIDYTLRHDDGQRMSELGQADVILVGVSRASKSSTCFYLAYRGIRAANVPLIPGVPVPPELARVAPKRVIGLSINCRRLQAIRHARMHLMGVSDIDQYVDAKSIAEEVRSAHHQMVQQGWHRIDVSYLAIEEIARRVIGTMTDARLRRRPRGRGAE
jgi:regulator of PEP synthase PpsR (kinase-PPPase family)